MLNSTIQLKVKLRLNKIDSTDYDNIESWEIVEAFNKGQVSWCRRQLSGTNLRKEGDEQSKRRIDDLQILLLFQSIPMINMQDYYESVSILPDNYMEFKRVSCLARSECCPKPKLMVVYQAEEANVQVLLRDKLKQPNFEWGETFMTFLDNKIRVYTNGEFTVDPIDLYYYRQPVLVEFAGISNPYTGLISPIDIIPEFKDDIVEVMIDEAAAILSGDIESFNQLSRENEAVEKNN